MRHDRLLSRLDRADLALYRRAAARESPVFDAVLPRLTRLGDHGLLWLGTAAALALTGQRRAAVRGVASLALASTLANLPAKYVARRSRPQLTPVPLLRQLRRQPSTSSFPSGHSASAAAFALGVALETPLVAAPVAVLAAGVAYGRVHTGVHYPGDVVAGLALGASSALLLRKVWPVRPDRSGDQAQDVQAQRGRDLPAAKVGSLAIRTREGCLRLARDGEQAEGPGHLTLRSATRRLVVYLA